MRNWGAVLLPRRGDLRGDLGFGKNSRRTRIIVCGRRTGGRLGAAQAAGQEPGRAAGPSGPRAPLVFRVSLSTKWAADAGARLHLASCATAAQATRAAARDRAPYLGYWGLPRVPFLSRRRLHKICRGGGLLSVEEIICASARCSFAVSPRMVTGTPGLPGLRSMESKKGRPMQDLGLSPPDLCPTVVGPRAWPQYGDRWAQPAAFSNLPRPQPGGRISRTYRSRASELL